MATAANACYSSPILVYKTSAENLLQCSIFGVVKAASATYPHGYLQITLLALYNGNAYAAPVTYISAPQASTSAYRYQLNAIDLKYHPIPDYAFFEACLLFNPVYGNYRYMIEVHNCTFYTEPYP